jgi:uncharacterized protein (DUF2252 family)
MNADESYTKGRSARAKVPRSSHAEWHPSPDRTNPVDILLQQAKTREPSLVPIRHARMLVSPFTFYRGGAAIMAADLAHTPRSGIQVQCCGDAHLANFGGFESPERIMVFDINDFDETLPGPWEWDIKRLAASLVIAAQDRTFDESVAREAAAAVVRAYRVSMREFAAQRNLEVWYTHLDLDRFVARWGAEVSKSDISRMQNNIRKARSKDSLKAFAKLTERVDGTVRIKNDPPLLERFESFAPDEIVASFDASARQWIQTYSKSLPPDRRQILSTYRLVDLARKVVGVGSVGTRCLIGLFLGRDADDPLFLQIKEAEASVLAPHLSKSRYTNQGQRVVTGQRLMQASSDVFIGWARGEGVDGLQRDFYVRQLWDGKLSADLTTIDPALLHVYGQMCGWTLARAHARSGDRIAIAAYLGSGDTFDRAIVEFALAYAGQNAADYKDAQAAARDGRLEVATAETKTS